MKLKKLNTSYLLPGELASTVQKYLTAVAALAAANPFIALITALLAGDLTKLQQAITAVRSNSLINQVAAADALRDDLFITFRDMVIACRRRRDEAIIAAYGIVWPILRQAGTRLYALGYTEQSGKMEALIAQLDLPENTAAMETLGVQAIYLEMKEAQLSFMDIYSDRLDEDMRKKYPSLKAARQQMNPHIHALQVAIDILLETDPGTHDELADSLNTITTEIMTVARARKSRATNDNDTEEPTDEEMNYPEDTEQPEDGEEDDMA